MPPIHLWKPTTFLVRLSLTIIAGAAADLALAEGVPIGSGKVHVLFVGLDVALKRNEVSCRVVDVDRGAIRILEAGKRVKVSLRDQQFDTSMEPKVNRAGANLLVTDLKGEEAYSRRSDPDAAAAAQRMQAIMLQDEAEEQATQQLRVAQQSAAILRNAAASGQTTEPGALRAAIEQLDNAAANLDRSLNSPVDRGFGIHSSQVKSQGDAFDAYEVTFHLAAAEEIPGMYAVLRLLVRDPASPRNLASIIKFFDLGGIGPKSKKFSLIWEGLPKGLQVDQYFVHFYADGREFATNVSSNRIELSADEAFRYLFARHLFNLNASSAPIQVVTELLPEEFPRQLAEAERHRNVTVSVDADGSLLGLELEPATKGASDDALLESALREVRFYPAVLDGRPVKAKSTLLLSDFLP